MDNSDFRFLYSMLKERDPKANISHKKMPTYSEHVKFIKLEPYTVWKIIESGKQKVGTIYLSNNDEIGIFVKKEFQQQGIGKEAVKLLINEYPRRRFLANVSPKNKDSAKFFLHLGFQLIQQTYKIEK